MTTDSQGTAGAKPLAVVRCATTGAAVLGVIFVGCWAGAAVGWSGVSHMYINLFTAAPIGSGVALGIGLCWSLVFGAVVGGLTAVIYNAFGFLSSR